MNSHALRLCLFCIFLINLSYGIYTLNYHLNELLFPSCCEKPLHAADMKSLNFQEKSSGNI